MNIFQKDNISLDRTPFFGGVFMSDIPVEKKLQLIQQVRSQYHKNQYDLQNREQILYGRTSALKKEENFYKDTYLERNEKEEGLRPVSTFRFRIIGAIFFFLVVIIMDINSESIFGINTSDFFQMIAQDYDISSFLSESNISNILP